MLYWESVEIGLWKDVCVLVGINYIDLCEEIEFVFGEIFLSEVVIIEVMYGVIVFDVLWVLWIVV